MSLFTDGFVSEVSDLVAYEADLPDVAAAEGIDLATKLRLAQTEVGAQLEAVLGHRRAGDVLAQPLEVPNISRWLRPGVARSG